MEQTELNKNWLNEELEQVNESKFDGESLPALKLEEGKVYNLQISFEKPFDKWTAEDGTIKKIIPVLHEGERKNFWLNVRNPIYSQILQGGTNGQVEFKVIRSGQLNQTRYSLVRD